MSIKFKYLNRSYDIKWNGLSTILMLGDSSVGKSLLCSDIQAVQNFDSSMEDILVINSSNYKHTIKDLKNEETYKQYTTIVIDNADIIITPEIDKIIQDHSEIRWLLLGRDIPDCVKSLNSIGYLEKGAQNHFTVSYGKVFVGGKAKAVGSDDRGASSFLTLPNLPKL